jgi:TatD DNase family protein
MSFIDTHSHIYLPEFDADRLEVISRAQAAGITHIVLPNVDQSTLSQLLSLEATDPAYFHPAIGIHPTSINKDYANELAWVKRELDRRSYCAIGEVGIDLYWDTTFRDEQIIAFEQQLQWAVEYRLPVIIHQRNAFEEVMASVEKFNCPELRGVFHSFGGTLDEAQRMIALENFYLGINGVVTFKNSTLSTVLSSVSLDRLVLETDAPYLSPVPYRGKRNESSYMVLVAQKLSEIYHITLEETGEVTSRNALQLFGL